MHCILQPLLYLTMTHTLTHTHSLGEQTKPMQLQCAQAVNCLFVGRCVRLNWSRSSNNVA